MKSWREWLGRAARVLIPLLFTGLAIWWVQSRLDFGKVWEVLKGLAWPRLVLQMLVMVCGLILRALAFSEILGDNFSRMSSFHGMNAGYLLNNLLPLRLGEVGRAGLLASHGRKKVSFFEVFAGIVTERTLDMIIGMCFFIAGLMLIDRQVIPVWAAWLGLVLLVGAVVLAALGAKNQARVIGHLNQRYGQRRIAREKLIPWLNHFLKGFRFFLQPRKFALAGFFLTVSWLFAMLEVYLLQDLLMPGAQWWWPFVALTFGVFINALPSVPGGIGVYEAAIVGAYELVGADPEAGLAIALVLHVYQLVVPSVLGVIGVYALGDNLASFVSKARLGKPTAEDTTDVVPAQTSAVAGEDGETH